MSATRPSIMIIDDEERIRRLLSKFFDDYDDFVVRLAHSGEEAIEKLSSDPVEVAIVDLRLPDMSGVDFIRTAKREKYAKRFLVHSGSADLTLTDELIEWGLTDQDLFSKPASLEKILARVQEMLDEEGCNTNQSTG